MYLYKILVQHLSPKDSHTAIEKYIIAENDGEVYDEVCGLAYWDEDDPKCFCEKHIPDIDEDTPYNTEEYEQLQKEFIISTKGEINSDWACYDDLFYGRTHYGWEKVNYITKEEALILIGLGIIDGKYSLRY